MLKEEIDSNVKSYMNSTFQWLYWQLKGENTQIYNLFNKVCSFKTVEQTSNNLGQFCITFSCTNLKPGCGTEQWEMMKLIQWFFIVDYQKKSWTFRKRSNSGSRGWKLKVFPGDGKILLTVPAIPAMTLKWIMQSGEFDGWMESSPMIGELTLYHGVGVCPTIRA